MVSILESVGDSASPISNALAAGLTDISYSATVEFSLYARVVLPIDGYVFWVRSDLISDAIQTKLSPIAYKGAATIQVPGSLHLSTTTLQQESQNVDVSTIILTTTEEVRPFHDVSQDYVWIGNFEGIRFGIDARHNYYKQAKLHHYTGNTIIPTIATQIIDDITQLRLDDKVVSNSLPFFLALGYQSAIYDWLQPPEAPIFPAYLMPDNQSPPYIAVNVEPMSTQPLQSAAVIALDGSRWQLVQETVRLTFYGMRNQEVMDALDYIIQWSCIFKGFGIMNSPVIRDEQQPHAEIGALAIKKSATLTVNYYQSASRDISWQLIKNALVSVEISD